MPSNQPEAPEGGFEVTLDNCAREPIHIPNAIQPHGALVSFDPVTGTVFHTSKNIGCFLPAIANNQHGRNLVDLFGVENGENILASIRQRPSELIRHNLIELCVPSGTETDAENLRLTGLVHVYKNTGVVELEPHRELAKTDWIEDFEDTVDLLRECTTVDEFVSILSSRFKRLVGLDRVMVYKFSENWTGRVIADAHESDMESFLDLHYPASDIPAQARELYLKNLVRYIADVGYTPVPLIPTSSPDGQLFNMSHCNLRSVSPMHIQYLRNMCVGSTLVMSIVIDDKLWGLISCQHRSPTNIPVRLRKACNSFAISASYILKGILLEQREAERSQTTQICKDIESRFAKTHVHLKDTVEQLQARLLKLGKANAGAFWTDGKIYSFGQWPGGAKGQQIVDYAKQSLQTSQQNYFLTSSAKFSPSFENANWQRYCGCAAINLDAFASTGLVWLRPEYTHDVQWGGNPNKAVQSQEDQHGKQILTPRTSFEIWREKVKGHSRPWTEQDRFAITSLLYLQQTLTVRESLIQVRLSDRNFRSLVSLQSEVYWQTDAKDKLNIFSRDLHFEAKEIASHSLVSLLEPYLAEESVQLLRSTLDKRERFKNLCISGVKSENQMVFYYQISGEPIRDIDNVYVGMHGTISDITADREHEINLCKAKVLADQANKAKSSFLANISHEMRTPLNALIGLSYLLEHSLGDSKHFKTLQRMKVAGQSLLSLINNVLDLAKIECNEIDIRPEPFDIQQLVNDISLLMEVQAVNKGLKLEIAPLPANLPELLVGDYHRIRQVIVNLISNAIKFTYEGSVSIDFEGSRPVKDSDSFLLCIAVEDTGCGIGKHEIDRVFEPFVQSESGRKSDQKGTGLGLAIVKQLIDLMGGKIQLSSEPGRGTRVSVELNLPASSARRQGKVQTSTPAAAPAVQHSSKIDNLLQGMSVLLVDDNDLNLLVAENILLLAGATVHTCVDGSQAIDWLKNSNNKADAVLMDLQMPVMDGLSATRILRAEGSFNHLPIIALTATSTSTDLVASMEAGMNAYLCKPIEPEKMIQILQDFRNGIVQEEH